MVTSSNDIVSMLVVVLLVAIILIIGFKVNRKPPRHQIYNERQINRKNSKKTNNLECLNCHHKNSIDDTYCEQCGTRLQ